MPSLASVVGDAQALVHVGAVGDHRQVVAGAAQRRLADRHRRRRRLAEHLLDARIAVERDVLVVEHRIGIGDRRRHQPARVFRRRRHDDLQARRAVEPRLGVLAVIRPGVAQPAPRHAHHHRHLAAPPVADLGGVVHQLVEAGGDEVVELHLADRPLAGQRRADADAEHRALGERRVEDAIAELLEQRTQQQERVAVAAADVLAVDEHARVGAQRVADAEHHRLEQRAAASCRTAARARAAAAAARPAPVARRARLEHFDAHARRLVLEHADAGLVRLGPRLGDHALRLRLDQLVGPRLQPAELACC